MQTNCKYCNTELLIKENSLLFEEQKVEEIAICPVCKNEVFRQSIDGWFFVQTIKDVNNELKGKVTFPMA